MVKEKPSDQIKKHPSNYILTVIGVIGTTATSALTQKPFLQATTILFSFMTGYFIRRGLEIEAGYKPNTKILDKP